MVESGIPSISDGPTKPILNHLSENDSYMLMTYMVKIANRKDGTKRVSSLDMKGDMRT
jgi:hypothetical protein